MNFLSPYKRKIIYFFKKKINIDVDNQKKKLSLENLFIKYGSDKASFWRQKKNNGHGFTKFYLKYFKKIEKRKLNILEIGSYSGASAAAFAKFFIKSNIFCLDINISNFIFKSKKIKVFNLDATKKKDIDIFFKKINVNNLDAFFDIIIDDGSHKQIDILKSFRILFRNLKPGGLYVIEDYKYPNFFKHLSSNYEPKIDKLFNFINKKKLIKSSILDRNFQKKLFLDIDKINCYRGINKFSNIAFIKKS